MSRDIRQIELPSGWPSPPEHMSFSTLTTMEACPLRWSLSNAEYSDLWPGNGYPTKAGVSAIVGQVIHNAVEAVLRGANSLEVDSFAIRMMATIRSAGGLTSLIDQCLTQVLDDYTDNPRMTALTSAYRAGRLTLPPTVRTSLQSLLSKVSGTSPTAGKQKASRTESTEGGGKALPFGTYTEITLYASDQAWLGKIDILGIGPSDISIEDIKTGKPKDADCDQLYIYSWLWWRDRSRNPNACLPTKLALRYVDSSVDVPAFDVANLEQFESNVLDRTAKAVADISDGAREARPDADICRYCGVRQLCDDYWSNIVPNNTEVVSRFGDVECKLISALSNKTWQVEIGSGSHLAPGTKALLRGSLPANLAKTGALVRVLDAKFVEPSLDESTEEIPEIQLRAQSEVFVRLARVTSE